MGVVIERFRRSPGELVRDIREGLPPESFVEIANALGGKVSHEVLALKLGLVGRTLSRKRRLKERLSITESERIYRVSRVLEAAEGLFGSRDAAREWILTPCASFGDVAPLDLLDTDVGTAEVEGLLKGLAYGNFQ